MGKCTPLAQRPRQNESYSEAGRIDLHHSSGTDEHRMSECGLVPSSGTACIANIGLIDNLYVTGGPYLIQPDKHGVAYLPMFNCAPYDIELPRNEFVAVIENVKGCTYEEVNLAYINSLSQKHEETKQKQPLTEAKRKLIEEKFCSEVPAEYKQRYLQVLLKFHEAISED